jgi:DNA excision repair protein ERCC-3
MINSNINLNKQQSFGEQKNNFNNANEVNRKDQSHDLMHKNLENRTLYVSKDGHIFLETFGKYYKETTDFLVAIAEPVNRTQNIHEYLLTKYSLYAAASMNIKTEEIILILSNLNYIKENTETYGKVKLILKNKRYFIECNDKQILKILLDQPEIFNSYQSIKRQHSNMSRGQIQNVNLLQKTKDLKINLYLDENIPTGNNDNASTAISKDKTLNINNNELRSVIKNIIYENEKDIQTEERGSIGENFFEIDPINLEKIKKTCIDMKFPLLEEYDFKNDNLPTMDIMPKLKNPARYYQEKALGIMFSNDRARSGIIVLPCGAGKTLVGIMAATTIKRNTIILCNSSVSVSQWYRECNEWSIAKHKDNICKFTSKDKSKLWNTKTSAGILITTYTMMAFQGTRSEQTAEIIKAITETEWGLMILDEVQVVPADMFRKILSIIKSHCKLGLTATLVREDKKIEDLNFLIGPKHYEANWLDLQKEGYLARVRCIEIWSEMNVDFYEEYLKSDSRRRMLLYVANPNKFYICKSLIEHHKNDKIIIFSDNLFCLKRYAHELKLPFISGEAGEAERANILDAFRNSDKVRKKYELTFLCCIKNIIFP